MPARRQPLGRQGVVDDYVGVRPADLPDGRVRNRGKGCASGLGEGSTGPRKSRPRREVNVPRGVGQNRNSDGGGGGRARPALHTPVTFVTLVVKVFSDCYEVVLVGQGPEDLLGGRHLVVVGVRAVDLRGVGVVTPEAAIYTHEVKTINKKKIRVQKSKR